MLVFGVCNSFSPPFFPLFLSAIRALHLWHQNASCQLISRRPSLGNHLIKFGKKNTSLLFWHYLQLFFLRIAIWISVIKKPLGNPLPSLLGIKLLVDQVCQCTNSVDWILFRHLDSQNITKQRHLDVQGLMPEISNEHVAISSRFHQNRRPLLPKIMTQSNKSHHSFA